MLYKLFHDLELTVEEDNYFISYSEIDLCSVFDIG